MKMIVMKNMIMQDDDNTSLNEQDNDEENVANISAI